MIKKVSWWQTVLLISLAALLIFAAWQIDQVGENLQYLIAAPAPVQSSGDEAQPVVAPNQQIEQLQESLADVTEDWQGVMARWTLTGIKEKADYTGSAASAQGKLTLIGENGLQVSPLYLRSGRLFHPEEIDKGEKVILLDEQLALEIFRVSAPIDREVSVSGEVYRVIGVVRHEKQVGDLMDYGAYIPLNSMIKSDLALDALMVEAEPLEGVGAAVAFSNVMQGWQSGGAVINLGKEGMAAGLWLRVLIFVIGMTAVLRLIRWLNGRVKYCIRRYRAQLQAKYAVRMLPELSGVILLFVLGYGLAAALVAAVMNDIIQPVYTFTEWIPAVLVEWEDIATAFWKVWQTNATVYELRSPELLRLQWLTLMTQGCSAGVGVLLALRYARIRTAHEATVESLRALYRQGIITAVVETKRPIAMSDAGYVCLDDRIMARVIHARRALEQVRTPSIDGRFVLEITDALIPANNVRWLITCRQGNKTITETSKEWDARMSAEVLTEILYRRQNFAEYMERHAGCTLRARIPLMDAIFDAKLTLGTNECEEKD